MIYKLSFVLIILLCGCVEQRPQTTEEWTISKDTLIDGVKTTIKVKEGVLLDLTKEHSDSINLLLTYTEKIPYRTIGELRTLKQMDEIIQRWKEDSSPNKISKSELSNLIGIVLGQYMIDSMNYEWRTFNDEIMVNYKSGQSIEFPFDLVTETLSLKDTTTLNDKVSKIKLWLKISKQLEDFGDK